MEAISRMSVCLFHIVEVVTGHFHDRINMNSSLLSQNQLQFFLNFFCLTIPKKDLNTENTTKYRSLSWKPPS